MSASGVQKTGCSSAFRLGLAGKSETPAIADRFGLRPEFGGRADGVCVVALVIEIAPKALPRQCIHICPIEIVVCS